MATETPLASTTAILADFVASTRLDEVPAPARHAAKRMVLDVTGAAIAGASEPRFGPIRAYALAVAGRGEVPVPAPRPLDVPWAALLVGTAGHLLDYDDVHTMMGGHPSVPLLPVLFSLGYALHATGAEALRAFALGAETEVRIGASVNPAHYSIGWHGTGVIGTLGACAAAAALLRLDAEAVRRAFGIAASHASGTKANFGTSIKSLHAGLAARGGVEAALLARAGATANDRILDEQYGGFCELFSTATDRTRAAEGLGERYLIVDPGIAFKLLPCCGSTQAPVWGVIDLWQEHRFDPRRVRAIRTGVDKQRLPHTDRTQVRTGLEGKFSTQYCQAVAALRGSLGLSDFEDEAVLDPERQEMMRRVHLYAAADAAEWPDAGASSTGSRAAVVEIEMEDGTVYRTYSPGPRGYPAVPASDADLEMKFLDCASRGLDPDSARSLAADLWRLEAVPDIAPLVERVWGEATRGG